MRAGLGTVRLVRADNPSALEFPDERQYWLMASSLRSGDGLADEFGFRATRMPLYPGVLSVFSSASNGVVIAKVLHWLIGSVAAAMTAGLAMCLFDRRTGLLAGLLVACDPFLVFFSSLLLTETLFVTWLIALWWLAGPILRDHGERVSAWRWFAIGAVAALTVYTRESGLGLVVVLLAIAVVGRRFDRRSLVGAGVVLGMVVVSLLPWAIRNKRVTGEWCWFTHRAGVSLYDGVGPQATGASDLAGIQQMEAVRGLDEVAWNRWFLRESLAEIRSDPARIVRLAWVKMARMWNPLPNVETYQSGVIRFVSVAWMVPVFVFGLGGVVILTRMAGGKGWRIALLLLLPALYLSAMHCLFVGSVRYRLPAMPMIEVLAAFAATCSAERLLSRRGSVRPGDAYGE